MDLLLVFGKITAKQCDLARLQMLKRGLRPRIVRIDPEEQHRDELEFVFKANEELKEKNAFVGLTREQQQVLMERRMAELKNELLRQALGNAKLKDIKAILLPSSDQPDDEKWQWLTLRIKHKILEYTVYEGGSDGSYVVGPELEP